MGVVKATASDIKLLARLMYAEAVGEGTLGMLLVGNVGINRVRADCSDFKGIRTIPQMIYQPHAFQALQYGQFYKRAKAREKRLARKAVNGYWHSPAKYCLWYFKPSSGVCPSRWYSQPLSGKYKHHCFYEPTGKTCTSVYMIY